MGTQPRWSGSWIRARAGETVASGTAGTADAGDPFVVTTRSQAGSISKQVVAVAVLQLVEHGVLALTDTVGNLLREPDAAWHDVTVAQLLSQTGGVGHWRDLAGLDITNPPPRDELHELIATTPLRHAPGSRFAYSGPGYLLAARIVEAVTGRPYSEHVTEHVLRAAGMTDSTSGECAIGRPRVARGNHDGRPVALSVRLSTMPGTGDLWTTTDDLVRFARALHGGALVSRTSLEMLRAPHVRIPDDSGPLTALGYGFGTYVGTLHGKAALFHPGDNPGYTSLLVHLPDTDEDIVLLANDDTLSPDDMAGLTDPP